MGVSYHLVKAVSSSDISDALALRYQAYRKLGTIPENPSGRFEDALDNLPTAHHWLIENAERQRVGAVRVMVAERPEHELTCSRAFPDEIRGLLVEHGSVMEPGRLAIPDAQGRRGLAVLLEAANRTYVEKRPAFLVVQALGDRVATYQRLVGLRPLAGPRRCPVQGVVLHLLGAPTAEAQRASVRIRTEL